MIPFTQYLRPDGRKIQTHITRSQEIELLAFQFMERGGYFEVEELRTGHVSLTAGHPDCETGDCVTIVVPNGVDVPEAVDKLVRRAIEWTEGIEPPEAD